VASHPLLVVILQWVLHPTAPNRSIATQARKMSMEATLLMNRRNLTAQDAIIVVMLLQSLWRVALRRRERVLNRVRRVNKFKSTENLSQNVVTHQKITMRMECARTATTLRGEQRWHSSASTTKDDSTLRESARIATSVSTTKRRRVAPPYWIPLKRRTMLVTRNRRIPSDWQKLKKRKERENT